MASNSLEDALVAVCRTDDGSIEILNESSSDHSLDINDQV